MPINTEALTTCYECIRPQLKEIEVLRKEKKDAKGHWSQAERASNSQNRNNLNQINTDCTGL